MQRLILSYPSGDGYTWSATNTLAVEYASAEALAVDFEEAVKSARAAQLSECTIAAHKFYPGYFFYDHEGGEVYEPPFIGTFDEWFDQNRAR